LPGGVIVLETIVTVSPTGVTLSGETGYGLAGRISRRLPKKTA